MNPTQPKTSAAREARAETEHAIAMEQSRETARSIHRQVCDLQAKAKTAETLPGYENCVDAAEPYTEPMPGCIQPQASEPPTQGLGTWFIGRHGGLDFGDGMEFPGESMARVIARRHNAIVGKLTEAIESCQWVLKWDLKIINELRDGLAQTKAQRDELLGACRQFVSAINVAEESGEIEAGLFPASLDRARAAIARAEASSNSAPEQNQNKERK